MRPRLSLLLFAGLVAAAAAPASAQTGDGVIDRAAAALRSDPVYVDTSAERAADVDAGRLRDMIRRAGSPIFLAVLPRAAVDEVGGDPSDLPRALGEKVRLSGTYGVVAGNSFRAASTNLPPGRAGSLATAAFQAESRNGTQAVLADFVDRIAGVGNATASGGREGATDSGTGSRNGSGTDGGGGGSSALPLLLLAGAGGAGFFLWRRARQRRQEEAAEEQADLELLRAEASVLAEDVMRLESDVALHPDAREDYDAGVARYRVAQAALEQAGRGVDLVRVRRVIDEGRYAMARAQAVVDGRTPPPPPPELARPGRHDEPALELDDERRPVYAGYAEPFYGGGWFGGGGGLLTGLFLGQMLGGWGGGYHEHNVYVDDGGGDGDAGAADFGGGDFGGGDFGGGDFGGGGDVGGGDWG